MKTNHEKGQPGGSIVLYQNEEGKTRGEVRVEGETGWLSQRQVVELLPKKGRTGKKEKKTLNN